MPVPLPSAVEPFGVPMKFLSTLTLPPLDDQMPVSELPVKTLPSTSSVVDPPTWELPCTLAPYVLFATTFPNSFSSPQTPVVNPP